MDYIEISLLVENGVSDMGILGEWGVSMLIKYKNNKFIFDTGLSGIFIENSKKMGIDLSNIDLIVLSHHHIDHIGGLVNTNFADKKSVLAHSEVFNKVGYKIIGNYKKIISNNLYNISDEIFFLGEIPRISSFEKGYYGDEKMLDDTALAIKTNKGVVVITGCSHSGIVNICEYAKKVTGEKKLYGVLGGFHLLDTFGGIDDFEEGQIEKTLEYFRKENPKYLYPFHCVDFNILCEFKKNFNIEKLSTGNKIIIK